MKEELTDYDKYCENPLYRFFLQQLLETGLTFETNKFTYVREGVTATAQYLSPDKDGNVRFLVPDIFTGDLEQYTAGSLPHIKIRDWYLTRWQNPIHTETGIAKYTPVKGGGTRCLFTKPVVDAFTSKTQIKTLFLIEGFKKALAGAVTGLPMVGMNGLNGFKDPTADPQKLLKEIREVITVCNVQRVVLLVDSDLFDLSSSKDKPASTRPNIFYRAALLARILIEPFADVYLSHPNPDPVKKYGLDDLLLKHRDFTDANSIFPKPGTETETARSSKPRKLKPNPAQNKIIKDLLESIDTSSRKQYFTSYKLSSFADYKIKQLFHLDNVQSFYEFYREVLQKKPNQRFQFYTHIYQIQADGTLIETEANNTAHLNIEVRFGKLVRQTDKGVKELANFSMKVLFQIDSEDDPKRIVEITNYDSKKRTVEITSKTFVSLADFQALLISHGDFIWKGTKEDLLDVMTILFKHEKPAILVSQLGWQPLDSFYAFSNGIVTNNGFTSVDEYGMVTHDENNFYFPAWSKFNHRDFDTYKDVKNFSHFAAKKPVTFTQWKKQFSLVYGEAGEISAAFYISTLFSDIIFSHKSGIGFPLLWSAGKPKTGKSTICTSLLSMFGKPSEAIGLAGKSTIKYFINRFAQVRNGLIHLDEYSNTKVNKDVKETLKNIYDRIGYGRKAFSNDFRTINTPILSAAMVSGEEIPTDNHALFTRAILLLFNKDAFTTKEREDFLTLRTMEEASLTHITIELLSYRQLIEDNFDTTYDFVFARFYQDFKDKRFDDRMLKNASWIVTPVKILMDHNKINFGISFDSLISTFTENIERQTHYMDANTDVAKFWDIIEMLHARREITAEKGDFRFVDELLAIRLARFHLPYAMEAQKLRYEKILDKSTLQNYLTHESSFVDIKDDHGNPKKIRFNGSTPSTAMFFRYKELNIDLKYNHNGTSEFDESDDDILGTKLPESPAEEVIPDAEQKEFEF